MKNRSIHEPQEIDQLKYSGNSMPVWVLLPWLLLMAYVVYYLAQYMWPDLVRWLASGSS